MASAGRVGIPLTDAVIITVARLVDDSQTETREPSHSAIEKQARDRPWSAVSTCGDSAAGQNRHREHGDRSRVSARGPQCESLL